MTRTQQIKRHDTAVVVVIGEKTSDLVLIKSSSTGLWRSPGDRVRDEDIDPIDPKNRIKAASNAARRITRERTGLTLQVRRVVTVHRETGTLYGYAGLADFGKFSPNDDGENTKIIPYEETFSLDMSMMQKEVLEMIIDWIRS